MLKPIFTGQFKKDYKRAVRRGFNPRKLENVIAMLCSDARCRHPAEITPLSIRETIRICGNVILSRIGC